MIATDRWSMMKLVYAFVAILGSPQLEGSEVVPTLTIESVRPWGYIGGKKAVVADVRIQNDTQRSCWYFGQDSESPFYAIRNGAESEWRSGVLCGTGSQAYELPPGEARTFAVISSRDSLAVQVSLRSSLESTGSFSVSSKDVMIDYSKLNFSWIDARRFLPVSLVVLPLLVVGVSVWNRVKSGVPSD